MNDYINNIKDTSKSHQRKTNQDCFILCNRKSTAIKSLNFFTILPFSSGTSHIDVIQYPQVLELIDMKTKFFKMICSKRHNHVPVWLGRLTNLLRKAQSHWPPFCLHSQLCENDTRAAYQKTWMLRNWDKNISSAYENWAIFSRRNIVIVLELSHFKMGVTVSEPCEVIRVTIMLKSLKKSLFLFWLFKYHYASFDGFELVLCTKFLALSMFRGLWTGQIGQVHLETNLVHNWRISAVQLSQFLGYIVQRFFLYFEACDIKQVSWH